MKTQIRNFIFIPIFLLTGYVFSQNQKTSKSDSIRYSAVFKTCEMGNLQAKSDFNEENYFHYSYGLVYEVNPDFSDFFEKYMKSKYKVIFKNGGCVLTDYSECYSKTMSTLLKEKFGDNIFEKSLKEAKDLYAEKGN